ncbi:Hypothetical protein SRAE_2000252800 [Strongyloides ratti]|uniref:Uncharacterized protein n=1 Tax=Strongyloides ratti TaxID=34506 RepID=A0A090LDI9_STRRB|nr:Hypothetical protein SRAE_2000252800 [Strongyloides ratti]CEF67866.1 Hypothetical protein SRAE_2000252800 [Strongyloides ratti]
MDNLSSYSSNEESCRNFLSDAESTNKEKIKQTFYNNLKFSTSDIESFNKTFSGKKSFQMVGNGFSKNVNPGNMSLPFPKTTDSYTFDRNVFHQNGGASNEILGEPSILRGKNHLPNFFQNKSIFTCHKIDNTKFNSINCLNKDYGEQCHGNISYNFNECNKNDLNEGYKNHLANKKYNINCGRLPTIEEIKLALQNPSNGINFSFYELSSKFEECNEVNVQNMVSECFKHKICQEIIQILKCFLDGQCEIYDQTMEYLVLDTFGIDSTEFKTYAKTTFSNILEWGIKNKYFLRLENMKILLKNEEEIFENESLKKKNLNNFIDENTSEIYETVSDTFRSSNMYLIDEEFKGMTIILYVLCFCPPITNISFDELGRNIYQFCNESFDETFCKKYFNNSCIEDVFEKNFKDIFQVKRNDGKNYFVINKNGDELFKMFINNAKRYANLVGKTANISTATSVYNEQKFFINASGIWIPSNFKFENLFF